MPFIVWLVQALITLAIQYGVQRYQQERAEAAAKKQAKKNAARKLSVTYGENDDRRVLIGVGPSAGHEVYRNTYGKSNKYLEIVYRLSDWYETSLLRVGIDGEWVTLGSADADGWRTVTSGDFNGIAWVKYYDGRQATADADLIADSNPSGRWTSNHVLKGIAYAIIRVKQQVDDPVNEPRCRFERQGVPLYDWRKDDTAGGSGSHRWDDVSTWEFSENPILAAYCYMRGGFNWNGDIFCGMDIEPDWLPLDKWTVAADHCDETINYTEDGEAASEKRYRVSTDLVANSLDHGQNIDALLKACAGMLTTGPTSVYPVINALVSPVATLSDDDLIDGEPVEFDRDGSFADRINSIRGTYPDPEHLYEDVSYDSIILDEAITLDRRTRDDEMSFPTVPSKRQANQLASIYLWESRFPCRKTVTVDPKWQCLEPGVDWITWTDDVDGQDRLYQVISYTLMGDSDRIPRGVVLELMERNADIYDAVGPITLPTVPAQPGAPEVIDEALDFDVDPVLIANSDGTATRPAIRTVWTVEDDDTVESILIEYWPQDQPNSVFSVTVPYNAAKAFLQEGVVAETVYEVRHKLVSPVRSTAWASAVEVETGEGVTDLSVPLLKMQEDLKESIRLAHEKIDGLTNFVSATPAPGPVVPVNGIAAGMVSDILDKVKSHQQRVVLQAGTDALGARVTTAEQAIVDGDTALASSITAVEATAASNTAAIATEASARADADTALASDITALESTVAGNTAAIASEATTRANADSALSTSITSVEASATANASAISAEEAARIAADSSLATDIATNAAAITTEQTARADADSALSSQITTVAASAASNATAISDEETARENADTALAADIATNAAAITTEATARADGDSALASQITTVAASAASNASAISTEEAARIAADSALATDIATNTAAITAEATARADGDSALASDITTLTASVTSNSADIATNAAAITTEATARADADTALASDITTLQASVTTNASDIATNAAAITSEASARAAADSAIASDVTTLQASVSSNTSDIATNSAAISTEETVRAAADSANASAITTLQTTVGDVTAGGIFKMEATTAPTGFDARMMCMMQGGVGDTFKQVGWFADVQLDANGGDSQFGVIADKFFVSDGTTNASPFSIIGTDIVWNGVIRNADNTRRIDANGSTFIYMDAT